MPCASMGLQSEVILEPWPDDMGHGAVDHPGSFRGLRFEGVGEQLPAANRNVPPYPSTVYLQYSSINNP
jgi:hypothetical protein